MDVTTTQLRVCGGLRAFTSRFDAGLPFNYCGLKLKKSKEFPDLRTPLTHVSVEFTQLPFTCILDPTADWEIK